MSNDKDAEQMELDLGLNTGTFTLDSTVDLSSFTNSDYVYTDSNTITINTDVLSTGDYSISDDTFIINTSFEEWVDTMPSMSKIKGMCEQYPAFQKEFEKFRQMYNLIKDDYEANNEDDIPF
jgi:hypothetical protein